MCTIDSQECRPRAATRRWAVGLALACAAALPARAGAELPAAELSVEVEVAAAGTAPAIAVSTGGAGIVAWLDRGVAVRALRAGGGLEAPRRVRATALEVDELRAGAAEGAAFVLVWQEHDGDRPRLLAQRLRAHGEAGAGALRQIAQPAAAASVALGVAPDGRFAVLFTDQRPLNDGEASATARLLRFAADGRPLTPPARLAGGREPLAARRLVAGGVAAGASLVSAGWTAISPCDDGGVDRRAAVARLGWNTTPAQAVASFADGRSCAGGPRLAALLRSDAGALAVFAGHDHNLQRFDASTGEPSGPRTVFAAGEDAPCPPDAACRTLAAVAGDQRGRFAVVWDEELEGQHVLTVQLFGREGEARSGPILLSSRTSAWRLHPAAALAANGRLHVVWEQRSTWPQPPSIRLRSVRFD